MEVELGLGIEVGLGLGCARACGVARDAHAGVRMAAMLDPIAPPWKPGDAHAPRGFQKGSSMSLRSSSTLACGVPSFSACMRTAWGILEHFHAL